MSDFTPTDLVEAYKLVQPAVLIATKGEKAYDLTPIGWVMPMDYEPVTKIIFSSDPKHQCAHNIKETKEFAVCMPTTQNDPIIEQCGSISSADADKFKRFGIESKKAEKIDVLIPHGNISSWIECRLVRVIQEGSVELFIGESVAAFKK